MASSGVTLVHTAYGRALAFSGSGSYLSFDSRFAIGFGATVPFSLATWFYVEVPTHGALNFFGTTSDGSCVGIGASDLDTDGSDIVGLDQGSAWYPTGFTITSGWHHLVYSARDVGGGSFSADYFLDGILVATTGWANGSPQATWKWWLGNEGNTSIRNLPCKILDARLYREYVSIAQVRHLFDPMTRWDLYAGSPRRWLNAVAGGHVSWWAWERFGRPHHGVT